MKLKKFLILFLVLLAQNVFAKQFKLFFPAKTVTSNKVVISTVLTNDDISLLKKFYSIKKEHQEAVLLLVDSLYEKEKKETLSKKDEK